MKKKILGHPDREQIYEAHDAVNYLIIVFPLCDMNLLEYKERGLMTEDKVRDHRNQKGPSGHGTALENGSWIR